MPPSWAIVFRILYSFLSSLARLAVRSGRSKDLEIIVLRHENTVLRRQKDRPVLNDEDRSLLGAIAAALPRRLRQGWIVTPETLLRWHRKRIARHWTQPPNRRTGRPPAPLELRQLIVRLAQENPAWGYRRIQGELARLGHTIARTTVWQILKTNDIDPSPNRSDVTWTQFVHSQAAVASDFFAVDTAFLRRYYVLFFINVNTRQAVFAGITANPTRAWTTQAARNLFLNHTDQLAGARALVRGRGSQFTNTSTRSSKPKASRSSKLRSAHRLRTRSPSDGLDQSAESSSSNPQGCPEHIIWSQRQLERLVVGYIAHHNTHRPLQSLNQRSPTPPDEPPEAALTTGAVIRTSRCDGLVHEYRNAA
jgi:hypothetical protein